MAYNTAKVPPIPEILIEH